MNTSSPLIAELKDKEYRDGYVAAQISIGLPNQIRALRVERKWTQSDLARMAKMAQPRICEIEKPGERRLNLDTLQRIASAFDVGLEVNFVPFSNLMDRSEKFDPDAFSVKSFDEEIEEAEESQRTANAIQTTPPVKTTPVLASVKLGDILAGISAGGASQQAISVGAMWKNIMPIMTPNIMSLLDVSNYAKILESSSASWRSLLEDTTRATNAISSLWDTGSVFSTATASLKAISQFEVSAWDASTTKVQEFDPPHQTKLFLVTPKSTEGKPEDVQEDAMKYSIERGTGTTLTLLPRKYA